MVAHELHNGGHTEQHGQRVGLLLFLSKGLLMRLNSLQELLVHELKDLYSAENQLVKALPKMAKAASSAELQAALQEHWEVTRAQVERLDKVFEQLDVSPRGKKCKAMEGLIQEGKEIMDEDGASSVRDAALIGAAQRVEHYEMAGYGCVRTYARQLGYKQVANLLQKTLDEEAEADRQLTALAESLINPEAEAAEEPEDNEPESLAGRVKDVASTAVGKMGDLVESATHTVKKAITRKRSRR